MEACLDSNWLTLSTSKVSSWMATSQSTPSSEQSFMVAPLLRNILRSISSPLSCPGWTCLTMWQVAKSCLTTFNFCGCEFGCSH